MLAAVHAGGALVDRVPALDLVAEDVDVVVERLGRRERRLVGELDGLVDPADDLLVEPLGLALLEHALLLEPAGEDLDRVALAPLRDLLLGAVLLGVGHRVAAEAVGDRLHQDRLALLARRLDRLGDDRVGVEHVHAVALQARDAEALAAAVQVGHGRVALERGAHAELVVGDHEDHRQLPQRGEVERLAEGALVGRAVAEHAQGDLVGALVVAGERHPGGQRQVAADDAVAAHEAVLEVEHVHRPAAPVRDAVLAAEQLGHHAVGVRAARERVAVGAVGGDQVVLVAQRPHGADDRRLLADREVQEAADLGLGVHLARALLEAADEHHRLEPLAGAVAVGQLPLLAAPLLGHVCHLAPGSYRVADDGPRVRATHSARTRPTPRPATGRGGRSARARPPRGRGPRRRARRGAGRG